MYIHMHLSFPQWQRGEKSACHTEATGDVGMISGSGRSPEAGHGNALRYSCLQNFLDRGSWRVRVYWVTKSWTWLKWLKTHTNMFLYMFMFIYTFTYTHMFLDFLILFLSESYKSCQNYLLCLLLWMRVEHWFRISLLFNL